MEPGKFSGPLPRPVEWYLRIRPDKISWLRFILEGYDGLAILTTISAETGLVRLRSFETDFQQTMLLLNALASDLTQFYSHVSDEQ